MPTKYYQKTKENSRKRPVKVLKTFLKKKTKKSVNIIVNATKSSLKVKNKD